MQNSPTIAGFLQCNGGKLEEDEDFKCVFVKALVSLVCELLSNNSLLVGQMYEDNSHALHIPYFIFFTTDLQTVNYYSTIHC